MVYPLSNGSPASAPDTRRVRLRAAGPLTDDHLVLRSIATLVAVGALLGLPPAVANGGLLGSNRYQESMNDWATLSSLALIVAAVGLIACAVPARRARRLNPAAALCLKGGDSRRTLPRLAFAALRDALRIDDDVVISQQTVAFQAPVQGPATDAELRCRNEFIAAFLVQNPNDPFPFEGQNVLG